MSFFKSLLLAIVATFLLTYFLGASVLELLGLDVTNDVNVKKQLAESLKAISISALLAILASIIVVTVVLGVFGAVIFAVLLVAGVVFMFLLGAFWPICLVAFVIWLMVRDSNNTECISK